ncbi:hypothetical protein [Sulfitobacter pacificus]|uniref:HipA-like C-terminal domain-containing protein n=1 Tax=Sulfitobacter pacificus TaxID=1499314 RepID=A0ABQ5VE68_9RHOB|nr:hypothetical protein [Sulfitobacter pacificus]GLQ25785.1 hypothetical protein GCM10007927_05880 [Sulfitobacter pacificus]
MVELVSVMGGLLPFKQGNLNQTFKALVQPKGFNAPFSAIVKDLPIRELFNELVSFVVLRALGLPIPSVYLGMVGGETQHLSKAPSLGNGSKLVYVSEEIPSPSLKMAMGWRDGQSEEACMACLSKFVPQIACWDKLGELYAFDTWLANTDRNLGNIVFGGKGSDGEPKVWLIDHGRSFTGEAWKPGDLVPEKSFTNMLKVWATPFLTTVQKDLCLLSTEMFVENAKRIDVNEPIDFYTNAFGLSEADKVAAKNFLIVRLGKVSEHAKDALVMETIL